MLKYNLFDSYQVIIFDLDNTLYDESVYLFSAYNDIGKFIEKQVGGYSGEYVSFLVTSFKKYGHHGLFDMLLSHFGLKTKIEMNDLLFLLRHTKVVLKVYDEMEMEPPDSYPDDGWEYRFHVGTHRCDVEYADEKFISISYSGWVVRQRKGPYGLPTTMMATTIDCEEMKVLELKDVVSDLNGLCQMLMEDRFKHITAWDGEPDLDFYKVSTTYSREGAERDLLETLNGNDREIEWYIKERKMSFSERWSAFWGDEVDKALAGKDFVIVILKDNYNEYAY